MKLLYTSLFITTTVTIICASDLSTSINTFSNNLYKTISNGGTNRIFSPFSMHSAMSLVYEGAGGETASKLKRALHLPDANATAIGYKSLMDTLNSAKNVQLNIANKIYLQNGKKLKENFRFITENYFDAGVDNIDFSKSAAAANEINNWVKDKTHNKIDKLFEPDDFDSDTRAVLLNAIYFKGNWLVPFEKEFTRPGKFYVSDEKFIMHPMMFQEVYYDYSENVDIGAKFLKMPYENERFAMTVILPNSRTGLADLKKKLSNFDLNTLKLTKTDEKVLLTLPKFKIENTLNLEDNLKEMDLEELFTNAANFSNMIEGVPNLKIDKVIQKAFIEVNEEGAEAAAGTGIETSYFSLGPPQPIFTADHPFMFYITAQLEDDSITKLFVGQVLSPTYDV